MSIPSTSTTTGRFSIDPVPRIAAVPSGMIGMPTRVPSTPGFVIEKVAPWISSGLSLRSRARDARSLMRFATPTRFSSSALRTTGTISPGLRSTAMPMLMSPR